MLVAALMLLHGRAIRSHRLYTIAALLGLAGALASGAFWSSRHAGTGTQTSWGWPRMVYGRWVSWETPDRREGIHWRGIVENTVFYGAVAMLAGSLFVASRRKSSGNAQRAMDPN